MKTSPFHIYATARELAGYVNGDNRLLPAFASSDIKIYPYQVAAALFALRSPYLKGVILADEGSLGKTYEALLIATQRWYEGKNRQILILPTNLVRQWIQKIDAGFTLPYILIDTEDAFSATGDSDNPFEQDTLVVTTYDFAVSKADFIGKINWDLAIFDEADRLSKSYTGDNTTANILKQATDGAFRLLLTPTPITLSIMDIYGLLHFIDETVLPDEKPFYDRFFRKPENYPELSQWVSQYCFRTLKSQVSDYVNFPNRIPYTVSYELTGPEKSLYLKLEEYLALPKKAAYPKMDRYDLSLMYYHTLSSSPQALCRTLDGAIDRLDKLRIPEIQAHIDKEKALLQEVRESAGAVEVSGKMKKLLSVLKKCFSRLGELKAEKKAIIFTENLTTLKTLRKLLESHGYKGVLTYSGSNSRDYGIMEQFRNDKNAQILIATDEAAKGLDIEFCPVVVNYDLLYNAVELEQRITRSHRQGQQSDVLVVNLLGKDNFADVRIMELINKRVLQFDGIFGMSDDILGNFDADIDEILGKLRHRDDIRESFRQNLLAHKTENKELVESVESSIFTTFTPQVADSVTLTPEYIEDKIDEINRQLWEVVKWFFEDWNDRNPELRYVIDEESKTITAPDELPELFYYWNGSRNRPYRSLKQYGMAPDFKPHQGRITLASILGRHVLDEVFCETTGSLTVDAEMEPCEIGFYAISVDPRGKPDDDRQPYYSYLGHTADGRILPDKECRELMELPVVGFSEERVTENARKNYNSRIFTSQTELQPRQIDTLLPTDDFIQKRLQERDSEQAGQIGVMKHKTAIAKTRLEREADALAGQIKTAEQSLAEAPDRISRIQADKKLKVLQAELRRKQDGLFMDRMRLDWKLEQEIEEFVSGQQLTARVQRHFLIEVRGK